MNPLTQIFYHHNTPVYLTIVRQVRFLGPDSAVLRAAAGMVPSGQSGLNPALNAIQTMLALKRGEGWRIALLQTTPAQFHGRPDLAQAMTEELSALL